MISYDIDQDFKNYLPNASFENGMINKENLYRLGLIKPEDGLCDDDTIFETKFVYCSSHHRVHSVGWCSVDVINKRPLPGELIEEAELYALNLKLISKLP